MPNASRIGQLPDDVVGNQGLPSRIVSNKRVDMLLEQARRRIHVRLIHPLCSSPKPSCSARLPTIFRVLCSCSSSFEGISAKTLRMSAACRPDARPLLNDTNLCHPRDGLQ